MYLVEKGDGEGVAAPEEEVEQPQQEEKPIEVVEEKPQEEEKTTEESQEKEPEAETPEGEGEQGEGQ